MLIYLDCFAGISGDMTLGAFVDLGVPIDWLNQTISTLPLSGIEIRASSVVKGCIRAQRICVHSKEGDTRRNYSKIKDMIEKSPFSVHVKQLSLTAFGKIAEAEAKIHGVSISEVHFHEVGGIDAIVDIVGAALCIEYLGIGKVLASRIPLGSGFVYAQHGTLPVPAPATLEILKGVPIYGTGISAELVTPTGAAILTALADGFEPMPEIQIDKIGYGAGTRDLEAIPNVLRLIMGTERGPQKMGHSYLIDRIAMVETNIDDMNPEIYGFLMERLIEDGALDVCWIPVYMKKNRPGTLVQIICPTECQDAVIQRILTETSSIGVRYCQMERAKLARTNIDVATSLGLIRAKRIADPAGNIRIVPEYEACREIARNQKIPIRKVYEIFEREACLSLGEKGCQSKS